MAANHAAHSLSQTADEILRFRAEALALEVADEGVSDLLSLLLFRIGEEWYAVILDDVREIFQEYQVTTSPCVPDFILGVVNVRGEILSVTDPARLMHIGTIEVGEGVQPPAIVLTDGDIATAIVVDEIGDITDVAREAIEPPVSIIDRAQAEFVAGSVFVNGTMVGLINVERVLQPIGGSGKHDR